ncbi:MAG: AAA family ATPase [Chloroflexi bacterium]|nr:AAA family ATPase [Chloroflexota bacterium]
MSTFLVQVNKNAGYPNITQNRRYENNLWTTKPRDTDHGKVKPGDALLVYCAHGVPSCGRSLAFSVIVDHVSSDNVTFELGEPLWFPSPVKYRDIGGLVDADVLPVEFRKCGQQGFNIKEIEASAWELAPDLVGLEETTSSTAYSLDDIRADGSFLDQGQLEVMLQRLQDKRNLILQGPPGTGKTWLAKKLAYALIERKDEEKVRPMQFHPNLSYEDFVRGWRPQGDGSLALVDGPFLQVVEDAREDPDSDYVMVIEEINRGNPASIFGEMLTLLESDKRNPEEALALAYPRDAGERVYVPPNVYVIGTMNLADRSLAMVDLALRRRFAFFDLEPMLNATWREWVQGQCGIADAFLDIISQRINSLNEEIATDRNLGRQFRIGHSFVTPAPGTSIEDPGEWFEQIVETEIVPLLHEYWFDDPDRVSQARSKLLGTA